MKSIKNYNIFCLESMWAENPNMPRQTIQPLLEVLKLEYSSLNIAHLNCNTMEEFEHNLALANRKYGILYLALHGKSGKLLIQDNELKLSELANMMGKQFKNCGVHFGSCGTMNITKTAASDFIEKTGVSFISGYKKPVYWITSAAVDLIYLDYIVNNIKNPQNAIDKMKTQITLSPRLLGFTFISS